MTAPDDPSRATEPDLEARLRASLNRRAVATTAAADEADLRRRIESGAEATTPLRPTARHGSTTVLRAAAVLVVLLGLVGAALAVAHHRRGPNVSTGPAVATGLYVPEHLPAGWTVESIDVSEDPGVDCPCERAGWANADGDVLWYLHRRPPSNPVPTDGLTVDLGAGLVGRRDQPGGHQIGWARGDDRYSLSATKGVAATDLDAAARRLATAHGPVTAPPLDGYRLIDHAARAETSRSVRFVTMEVRTGTGGRGLTAQLQPAWSSPGLDEYSSQFAVVGRTAEGPTVTPAFDNFDDWLTGLYPRTAIRVSAGEHTTRVDTKQFEPFLSRLRPATAAEWAAFVRSVPRHDRGAIVDDIDDLAAPGRAPSSPYRTTTTVPVPTTTLPSASSSSPSSRGSTFSDLSDLRFSLVIGDRTVATGSALPGWLLVRNPTDHDIWFGACAEANEVVALVPVADRDRHLLEGPGATCDGFGAFIPAHGSKRRPVRGGIRVGWPAQEGPYGDGTYHDVLVPGKYVPTLEIPGRTSTVRVAATEPVTVVANPCGTVPTALRDEIADHPAEADAKQAAEGRGFRLVVVARNGRLHPTAWNLDCKRVRATLEHGKVVATELG